jgi:integrase
MEKFLAEKHACGYRYERASKCLGSLDRFLEKERLETLELPRALVERWTAKQSHESATSQVYRLSLAREFGRFLLRQSLPAFVPVSKATSIVRLDFVPHIFSKEEIRRLLEAADQLRPTALSPLRHLIFPEVFRLLYGCGLRAGEALRLTVADVDLSEGVLRIWQSKFRKDRLVPMAPSLTQRLRSYASRLGERPSAAFFFPAPDGGRYNVATLYHTFRSLLWEAGIAHRGRGQGPRLHDLRHTYAVHCLTRWYREGADLNAKLPILVTYMGHATLGGTQRYLRLTRALFPQLTATFQAAFGHVIPGEASS